MSFTAILSIGFLGLLALGGGLSFAFRKKQNSTASRFNWGTPAAAVTALSAAGMAFYLFSGYVWLENAIGLPAVQLYFIIFQVGIPGVAAVFCLVAYVCRHARFRYFVLFWVNLLFTLVGAFAWGISRM